VIPRSSADRVGKNSNLFDGTIIEESDLNRLEPDTGDTVDEGVNFEFNTSIGDFSIDDTITLLEAEATSDVSLEHDNNIIIDCGFNNGAQTFWKGVVPEDSEGVKGKLGGVGELDIGTSDKRNLELDAVFLSGDEGQLRKSRDSSFLISNTEFDGLSVAGTAKIVNNTEDKGEVHSTSGEGD